MVFEKSQERYARQIEGIRQLSPTFVCLQECYSLELQQRYREGLTPLGYHCVSCTHGCPKNTCKSLRQQNDAWLVHYAPHALLTLLCILIFGCLMGSFLWTIVSLLVVILLSPPWLPHVVYRLSPTPYDLLHGDALGLVILSRYPLELNSVRPHRFFVEAHEWALTITRKPYDVVERWFNHTFVNKGMLSLVCAVGTQRLLIVTAHFTTGVTNSERLEQAQEFHSIAMEEAKANGCHAVLVGLDTNAHSLQPEMVWLTDPDKGGFVDAMAFVHGEEANQYFTWDGRNMLTKGNLLEPDQRIDFLLYKSLGTSLQLKWEDARNVLNQPYVSDHIGVLGTFSCCT